MSERSGHILRVAAVAAIVVGGVLVVRFTPAGAALRALAQAIAREADEPWAAPAYVGLYALALALAVPGTLLSVIGGVAFGPAGIAVNLCGATLGAIAAFLEARFVAHDAAQRLFGRHLARLPDLADPRTAFLTFMRLRLIALVPFNGLNFAAGLTRARLPPYAAGTLVGIIPSTTVYTLLASEVARGGASGAEAAWRIAVVLVAAGLIAIAPSLIVRARDRMAR